MRYKTYFRRIISTGQVTELSFVLPDILCRGLTQEAALAEVNEWNRQSVYFGGNYQYWIE